MQCPIPPKFGAFFLAQLVKLWEGSFCLLRKIIACHDHLHKHPTEHHPALLAAFCHLNSYQIASRLSCTRSTHIKGNARRPPMSAQHCTSRDKVVPRVRSRAKRMAGRRL